MVELRRLLAAALASVSVAAAAVAVAADETPTPTAPATEAQSAPVPPAQPQTPPASSANNDDPIVCKLEQPGVGSRLRPQKVCKKRSEWRNEPEGVIHVPDRALNPPPGGGGVGSGSTRGPAPGG